MSINFSEYAPFFAEQLIGWTLILEDRQGKRGGIINETEAYTIDDEASHSYKGLSTRNQAMFSAPGTIYIYRIYGIHYCLNFVCGNFDGQAVLIRSLIPTIGIDYMKANRGISEVKNISNGPGKVIQALGIGNNMNNIHISKSNLLLLPPSKKYKTIGTTRIGITKDTSRLWRFVAE